MVSCHRIFAASLLVLCFVGVASAQESPMVELWTDTIKAGGAAALYTLYDSNGGERAPGSSNIGATEIITDSYAANPGSTINPYASVISDAALLYCKSSCGVGNLPSEACNSCVSDFFGTLVTPSSY